MTNVGRKLGVCVLWALVIALVACVLGAAHATAQPDAAPYILWRSQLTAGDPAHNCTLIYDYGQRIRPGDVYLKDAQDRTLVPADPNRDPTAPIQWWMTEGDWPGQHLCGLKINQPGRYKVYPLNVSVDVSPPPQRQRVVIAPGTLDDDADRIRQVVGQPNVELVLLPGEYRLRSPIWIGENSKLTGRGAFIVGNGGAENYQRHMVRLFQSGATVEGITFVGVDDPFVFWWRDNLTVENISIVDCTFRACRFGQWSGQRTAYVRGCRFESASAGPITGGVWYGIDITGRHPAHALVSNGNVDWLALIDVTMTRTDRGPILRPAWGPIRNVWIRNLTMDQLSFVDNGNEGLLVEPGQPTSSVSQVIVYGLRYYNSEGAAVQIGGVRLHDWKLANVIASGGQGVFIGWNAGEPPVERITITQSELRNCRLQLAATTRNCVVESVGLVDWRPTRGNQFDTGAGRYASPDAMLLDLGVGNVRRNVTAKVIPGGMLGEKVAR